MDKEHPDLVLLDVMMPIAAIATCLLVSRVVGVKKIEEEMTYKKYTPHRIKVLKLALKD